MRSHHRCIAIGRCWKHFFVSALHLLISIASSWHPFFCQSYLNSFTISALKYEALNTPAIFEALPVTSKFFFWPFSPYFLSFSLFFRRTSFSCLALFLGCSSFPLSPNHVPVSCKHLGLGREKKRRWHTFWLFFACLNGNTRLEGVILITYNIVLSWSRKKKIKTNVRQCGDPTAVN